MPPGRMPVRSSYSPVEDNSDSRVPLHNEEAFEHGIHFQAKYIGCLDVPRPSSRVEIVAAMRRIRYEFKAKNIKKKKVNIIVSVDGVKVILRKKQKRKEWTWDESKMLVMHDPVYRIFYVSHDSQDLKIFSYIARDGPSNTFRCNVFKSKKKSQAMRIVRTVGQAFEVCHKMSLQYAQQATDEQGDGASDKSLEEQSLKVRQLTGAEKEDTRHGDVECNTVSLPEKGTHESSTVYEGNILKAVQLMKERTGEEEDPDSLYTIVTQQIQTTGSPSSCSSLTPLASRHRLQLIQHQLLQQQQQTQVAVAQVQLLKDQLAAETSARIEAQARVRQLLLTNRDLLQHISVLVKQLKEMEIVAELKQADDKKYLQNVTIAQSISLNLKNLYSRLDLNLSSTSTPASLPSGSLSASSLKGASVGESYLNLMNLDRGDNCGRTMDDCHPWPPSDGWNGFVRKVEGSEVAEQVTSNGTQTVDDLSLSAEDRMPNVIPKLNPPPPVNRKRNTKTLLVPETEPTSAWGEAQATSSISTHSSLTDVTSCSLIDSDIDGTPRSSATKSNHIPSLQNAELCPIKERTQLSFDEELTIENGTFYSMRSSYDNLSGMLVYGVEATANDRLDKALEPVGPTTNHTLPFSSIANETCLHISFSEDELPDNESDDTKGGQEQTFVTSE